jgi:hypothetical protein
VPFSLGDVSLPADRGLSRTVVFIGSDEILALTQPFPGVWPSSAAGILQEQTGYPSFETDYYRFCEVALEVEFHGSLPKSPRNK